MSIADKILLGSLIFLLPIGLFLVYRFSNVDNSTPETRIDAKKLIQMINRLDALEEKEKKPKREFIVSSVDYASESSKLIARGHAPYSEISILATTLSYEKNEDGKQKKDSIEMNSLFLFPDKNNGFVIEVDVDGNDVVEIHLNQDSYAKSVKFDVGSQEQIF